MPSIYYMFYKSGAAGKAASRLEHAFGLLLLKYALHQEYGLTLPDNVDGIISRPPGGKPHLSLFPHIHFNISHCQGLVMCGADMASVGVDCEHIRPVSAALPKRVLTGEELAALDRLSCNEESRAMNLLRFWTLKEAWIKYTGEGLKRPMKDIAFDLEEYKEKVRIPSSEPDLYFSQYLTDGYVMSVCSANPEIPVFHKVPDDQFSIGSDQYSVL